MDYFEEVYPETEEEDTYYEFDYEDEYQYGPVSLVDA